MVIILMKGKVDSHQQVNPRSGKALPTLAKVRAAFSEGRDHSHFHFQS